MHTTCGIRRLKPQFERDSMLDQIHCIKWLPMHKQKAGRRTTSGGRGQGFEQFLVVKKSSYTPVDIYQDNIFGCMVYMCTATVHVFLFFHFHTSHFFRRPTYHPTIESATFGCGRFFTLRDVFYMCMHCKYCTVIIHILFSNHCRFRLLLHV